MSDEQPTINPDDLTVVNNAQARRFEVRVGDQLAFSEYMLAGSNIIFTHTEVPPALEGQGVGSRLARAALDHARDNALKVQALCPFIKGYVDRHPEYQAITWGY